MSSTIRWMDDVMRWLSRVVEDSDLADNVQHMGRESFKEFVKHNLPELWDQFKDYMSDIYEFVVEFL